ncbi:hypothetical protein GH714_002251 [Hevea brasiliensis]|uniref:PUM-HD domain-containing protein n=1 Tax=Hevea brasiliensis TaxID=3981 RepID=A0A6A6LHU3_HEVBR|nr:hypothetical protein GH714_002251 [Hevea brasiliensis]
MCHILVFRQQKLSSSGSPAGRASLQSPEPSPSSSLFPNEFCSPEHGSLYAIPLSEEAKYRTLGSQYWNETCLDSKSPNHDSYKINRRLVDEMGLSQSFCGMSVREDQNGGAKMKGFEIDSDGFGFGSDEGSMDGSVQYNSNDFCSGSAWYDNQSDYLLGRRKEQGRSRSDWGIQSKNQFITGPCLDDPPSLPPHPKMASNGGRGFMESMGAPQSTNPVLDLDVYHPLYRRSLMLKERIRAITNNGLSHSLMPVNGAGDAKTFSCEDSFIIQGKGNHACYKGREPLSSDKKNSFNETSVQNLRGKCIKLDSAILHGGSCENDQRLNNDNLLRLVPSINFLSEKFLDVCNEEQRLQIVFRVTEEQGQLVEICLNTYGTRAAQKLIETLKTRQQISLVVSSLKPGFLDLVKDQNGNHVIQRCLQCLSNEDNKFILDAAAKFCVEIATHRHGCCVMQRCITHSTGKHRDKLITEISKNSLFLAQDPFGNYVVQYIIEQKSPSAIVNLLSQFKGHYVHLSMQKFSSHVVEKCLNHLDESQEQIIRELISVSRFEQLLQDPFANYVIQSALAVTKTRPGESILLEINRNGDVFQDNIILF